MPTSDEKRPNILFIMADQWRYDYLGCAGADFIRTPNLDRIAERGVRFSNCFTTSPVCAPARISLATGLHPHRLGALSNAAFLPISTPTYYQRLRDHGYRVGCVGKLDLAKPDSYNGRFGDRPCAFGWGFTHPEEVEGKMHAGSSDTPRGPYGFHLQEKGRYKAFHEDYKDRSSKGWIVGVSHDSVLPTEDFADIYIGRRATEWIRNIPDDFPWHYFVSFVGPHDPFDPPTEYADQYRDAEMPPPIQGNAEGKPEWQTKRNRSATPEDVLLARRQYCASSTAIDDQVGEMLDALEERGQLDNTYLVFSSDHGEMLGDHGFFTKTFAYEASLHVPLLVAGPGIEGGRVSDTVVELHDINPTICEMASVAPQENIDARSFLPVARGEVAEHRPNAISSQRHWRCIRTKTHKYVENINDVSELYDLENDPEERHNIASEDRETASQLARTLHARMMEDKWLR